jgi:hypothetical protein
MAESLLLELFFASRNSPLLQNNFPVCDWDIELIAQSYYEGYKEGAPKLLFSD